ncbi:MAG TPA: DUF3604 domain-containing protein [Gammaproteobacteria bacterium]|jgi:hypothetical protein|nr:DUF3604 domain-containing protein [Gammaproteobacteria bacterium]
MNKGIKDLALGLCVTMLSITQAHAYQDIGKPSAETLKSLYPGKTYSPYAQRAFPDRVYWGDTHLHTALSPDAGLFGNTLGVEEAYRFARGEEVTSSAGLPARLGRPLDWLVVTDHTDMMGFGTDLKQGAPNLLAVPKSRKWIEGLQKGGDAAAAAALDLITTFSQGKIPKQIVKDYSPGSPVFAGVWDTIVDAAEKHNEPGRFTAFIGYEWTSVPQGNNLHRNVIFRDGGDRARQMMPMTTLRPLGSTDPLDLYKWMENYEAKTGGQVLALAHNGNLSNGWMFPVDKTYAGSDVNQEYVQQRAKWEPLYEITQIKGDGEAHPYLSPDDEFADYGTWDAGNLDLSTAKKPSMLQYEYAREALKQGLALEKKFGTNPYKFGFSGATDSHTSLATAEEENFFGKSTSAEPSKDRVNHPFAKTDKGVFEGYEMVSSGYTGVWATDNTREAIWDAMARREVYSTTGPRIPVRFFGGWDFNQDDLRSRAPAFRGYEKGVPMGGDLTQAPDGKAPTFMVYALRDPIGANLDRIQIVKGWMDSAGELHEKVYDVVWSDERKADAKGKLPSVGNTVDLEAANWTNTIGASELGTVWTDPDFDPKEKAFYYARVIEIPTPRWVLYDKVRLDADIPKGAKLVHQERAYTSPIWYAP